MVFGYATEQTGKAVLWLGNCDDQQF